MTKKEFYEQFERYQLSEFLPWIAYDPTNEVYLNVEVDTERIDVFRKVFNWLKGRHTAKGESAGLLWECVPRISNGDNTVQLIKSLFELGYPDIILQIILFADWHIAPILDRYASLTDTDNMLLFEWTKSQIEHYKAHTWHGFTETVPVPVRNFRLFFAVKIPYSDYTKELEKILEIKRSVEGVLSSGYFYPRSVPVEEFLHLVRGIFNPDRPREKYPIYDPDIEIRRQVILAETKIVRHARYLEIGDRFVKTLTVQGYRPIVDPSITQDLIGDTIVGKNLEQIPVPFILTLNVYLNRDLLKEKIQKKATLVLAQRAAGAIAPKLAKKQEELHWAIQHMEGKNTPVQVYLTLTLFCPPDKGATANITNTVKGFWENLGFKLQEDFFIGIPIFISALPFGLKFEACSDLSRFKTTFADAASCVAPTQTGWSGTKKPYALFVSRRGQLMSFDIFDSNSNYNALIAAQSGAGKSFFTNYLLTSYYRAGAKIWVIDVGRSYKKLCETFKGDFLVFSPDSHLCLNPFTNVENIDKELELIVPLLCQMMKPTEKATDWEKAALEQVIKDVFTQYGNKTTVTHIAEALRDHDDQRKKDMALMLTPYTKYGRFGKWFEGESTIDLGKTRFMTLELEELKQMRELQEVILLLVIYFIKHEMYLGGKDVLKIVTIDEAWDLFSGENTALFIESGYRRFRKYKGAAITITQSVEDFYKNEATKAITRNSNFWLLLSQLPEAIDSAVRSGYISLHPFQQEVLKSVHTIKGLYSEIFFRVNDTQEFGVGRLFPDPFSYYVFTTDAADLTLLKHIQEITGGDVTQAIRTASFIVKELMSKTKLNMFEAVRELANTPVRQLETLVNKQHQHETKKAA